MPYSYKTTIRTLHPSPFSLLFKGVTLALAAACLFIIYECATQRRVDILLYLCGAQYFSSMRQASALCRNYHDTKCREIESEDEESLSYESNKEDEDDFPTPRCEEDAVQADKI